MGQKPHARPQPDRLAAGILVDGAIDEMGLVYTTDRSGIFVSGGAFCRITGVSRCRARSRCGVQRSWQFSTGTAERNARTSPRDAALCAQDYQWTALGNFLPFLPGCGDRAGRLVWRLPVKSASLL